MTDVDKIILGMRQKVIDSIIKNDTRLGDRKYISWVMVALTSLACDIHRNTGKTKESFIKFIDAVWDMPRTSGGESQKPPAKKIIN